VGAGVGVCTGVAASAGGEPIGAGLAGAGVGAGGGADLEVGIGVLSGDGFLAHLDLEAGDRCYSVSAYTLGAKGLSASPIFPNKASGGMASCMK